MGMDLEMVKWLICAHVKNLGVLGTRETLPKLCMGYDPNEGDVMMWCQVMQISWVLLRVDV